MKNHLQDKVVIITGSGSGIGKATALLFCKRGAKVMLNGRDENKLKKTAAEFSSYGYTVSFFSGDITCFETCKKLADYTTKTFGGINVLITNAGISMNACFDEMSPELFKKIFDSNVYGTVLPLYASLNELKKSKGSVIFISSAAGFHGIPTASAYSAGKMALTALQQSLYAELHKHMVHIGILYVGFTKNDSDKKLMSSSGDWASVPKRPGFFQQSQNSVANSILKMVVRKTNKKTLSLVGISTEMISKFAPWIIRSAAILSQKKN